MPDGPAVRLRVATDDDDALLYELFRSANPDLALLPLPDDQADALVAMTWRAQRTGYGEAFPKAVDWIIETDGVAAGRLLVDDGSPVTIVDIAVLPAYRGLGLASAALRGLLADADARNVAVRLHVRRGSPAQRLYARLGFVIDDDADEGPDVLMVRPGA
jgi:ribosomal protein S18 acetylase RimI-like enzyme